MDVDKMSDAEIRTKLMEFGYPVMPITGTTRKLMVKKLKLLLDSAGKGDSKDRRSLGRYSSEEESDTDSKKTRNKEKNRRATMAAPANRTASSKTSPDVDIIEKPPAFSSVVHTTTKRSTTKMVKTTQDEFDTGSDSEPEIIEVEDSPIPNNYRSSTFRTESIRNYGAREPAAYSSTPKTDAASSSTVTTSYLSNFSNKQPTSPRYSAYNSNSSVDAAERLNQIRSRLSLGGNPSYASPSSYTHTEKKLEPADTPFLSNFTRRLSQLNSSGSKPAYGFKNDIKEHDTNGGDYGRPSYLGRSRFRESNRDYLRGNNVIKNNPISFVVLAVAFMFFVFIGVMYWGMRSGDSALETTGYNIPICKTSSQIDCINETEVSEVLTFMRAIKLELSKRALNYACAGSAIEQHMTEADVINFYYKLSRQDMQTVQKQLQLLEMLIFKNPEWEISIIQVDSRGEISQKNVLYDMSDVIELRPAKTIALVILYPDIPLKCRLYNSVSSIFKTFLILAVGFMTLYAANLLFKYYKLHKQRQKDELTNMVERIIDILQNNTSESADKYLVINHVRDMILPVKDRKLTERTWDEAVRFINDNESRVRTEVQVVNGEPFDVWRWISCPSLNTSRSPSRSNTWQGQAFETQVGSVNSLPCSPTPCLKIRGMLEGSAQNTVTIREAVLSKCAHQCLILHCGVDVNLNCVYIKCADQREAAVAYQNLHGWWYSGHLVTVKYLRLERYMQRFPDSPVTGPPYLKSQSPATDWSN